MVTLLMACMWLASSPSSPSSLPVDVETHAGGTGELGFQHPPPPPPHHPTTPPPHHPTQGFDPVAESAWSHERKQPKGQRGAGGVVKETAGISGEALAARRAWQAKMMARKKAEEQEARLVQYIHPSGPANTPPTHQLTKSPTHQPTAPPQPYTAKRSRRDRQERGIQQRSEPHHPTSSSHHRKEAEEIAKKQAFDKMQNLLPDALRCDWEYDEEWYATPLYLE